MFGSILCLAGNEGMERLKSLPNDVGTRGDLFARKRFPCGEFDGCIWAKVREVVVKAVFSRSPCDEQDRAFFDCIAGEKSFGGVPKPFY